MGWTLNRPCLLHLARVPPDRQQCFFVELNTGIGTWHCKISSLVFPISAPSQFPRNFHWLGFLCVLQGCLSACISVLSLSRAEQTSRPFLPLSQSSFIVSMRTRLALFLRWCFICAPLQYGKHQLSTWVFLAEEPPNSTLVLPWALTLTGLEIP